MTRRLTTLFSAGIVASLSLASAVLAAEPAPSPQPAVKSPCCQGTMSEHSGMMNMTGQMSSNATEKGVQMATNCDRMMERQSQVPEKQGRAPSPPEFPNSTPFFR